MRVIICPLCLLAGMLEKEDPENLFCVFRICFPCLQRRDIGRLVFLRNQINTELRMPLFAILEEGMEQNKENV